MTNQNRLQIEINKVLGVAEDGEIIAADYAFIDTMHGEKFNGVTGSRFYALTQEQIDERNDLEHVKDCYGYLWEEAVKSGQTKLSEDEYMEEIIESNQMNSDSLFLGHDTSYVFQMDLERHPELKKLFPDAVAFECVGGGRMFPDALKDLEHIFEPELCAQIVEIES